MATICLSNANTFLPSFPSTSSPSPSPSSSSSSSPSLYYQNNSSRRQQIVCRTANEASSINISPSFLISRRNVSLNLTATTALLFTTLYKGCSDEANAAILEADDDEELLEKVKKDRKKRLEREGVIKSSAQETACLQDLVYKLSKVGQAIEKNDLSAASFVLGSSKDNEWIQKVNSAFDKLSTSAEAKTEVDTFNSSLESLISSVTRNDVEASKVSFVASASALEKWTILAGLVGQLKGL